MFEGFAPLAALVVLLVMSGFFSSAETALMGVSRVRIRNARQAGDRRAAIVLGLVERPERLLSAILLGNNFVNVAASALATVVALEVAGQNGVALATVVMTALILIFAEIAPKTYAARDPEGLALRFARPVRAVVTLLRPFAAVVSWLADRILLPFGGRRRPGPLVSEAEIKGMVDLGVEERVIARQKRRILHAAFHLAETTIEDIMIPRTRVVAIAVDTPPAEVLQVLRESGHTRLPVYRGTKDDIVGILHAKDVLSCWERSDEFDLETVVRRPIFVPETASLESLLQLFRRHRQHMALVIDEFNGLEGIVTLEDLLEEIVGDILDEHDSVEEPDIVRRTDGSLMVRGECALESLSRHVALSFDGTESSTLAGFLMEVSGRVPAQGDRIEHDAYVFEVLRARRNRLEWILVTGSRAGETESS